MKTLFCPPVIQPPRLQRFDRLTLALVRSYACGFWGLVMRARAGCILLFCLIVGLSAKSAAAQSAAGTWFVDSATLAACPLFAIEILNNGDGMAWLHSAEPDPDFPEFMGRVVVTGDRVEARMTDTVDADLLMTLRGTVSKGKLSAQVTVTDGKDPLSGSCAFDNE